MATNMQQRPVTDSAQSFGIWMPSISTGHNFGRSDQSRTQLYKTQLKFNRDVMNAVSNLAVKFTDPRPIVIEKLRQPCETQVRDDAQSLRSSLQFSAVSEDRLNMAVQLARRDLRKKHLEEQVKDYLYNHERDQLQALLCTNPGKGKSVDNTIRVMSKVEVESMRKPRHQRSQAAKEELTRSGAKVYIYTSNQSQGRSELRDSPPTHDPGPHWNQRNSGNKSAEEIRRLRLELGKYFQKIEELTKKGKSVDALDPDEDHRRQVKRQEQATRATRMLYVLQQQINGIQELVEKQSLQKVKHTKKSQAMSQLAAVHRGAVRALQMFVGQLSGQSELHIPAYYKDLGQLIRQLSLCSARLENDTDSSMPETVVDILQQVEGLDSLLGKQHAQEKSNPMPPKAQCVSAPSRKRSSGRHRSCSAEGGQISPIIKENVLSAPEELPPLRTDENWLVPEYSRPQQSSRECLSARLEQQQQEDPPTPDRNAALRAGLETLQRLGDLKKSATEKIPTKKGVLLPYQQKQKKTLAIRTCFQKATVSSELKKNPAPVKDSKPPLTPGCPNPIPMSSKQIPLKKQKPRLGGHPSIPTESSQTNLLKEMEQDRQAAAGSEAIRLTWLDIETARRMRELNEICQQETDRIKKIRSETAVPNKLIEKAEEEIRERLQPLLDKAQIISDSWERKARNNSSSLQQHLSLKVADRAAASADVLGEKILDELLEDTAQELLSLDSEAKVRSEALTMQDGPTLEIMLQRMEEMERYEESVRRRMCQIEYSDPVFWAEEGKEEREFVLIDTQPRAPQPIRISRSVVPGEDMIDLMDPRCTQAEPLDDLECSGRPEPASVLEPLVQRLSKHGQSGTVLAVPPKLVQNMHNYRERFNLYLKMISHEPVGKFNPWLIAESLSEELMEGGLSEVATEFQDACEEYAEALFTAEFMQPVEQESRAKQE
ncbi:protein moonraker [Amblyraja radiata]|uniref:protein moonraker n=1 Tax=Amblyraja radiata TaxID=386614 RepID=UPI001401EF98|nr:protein moonraker [Amblyraja radiata]XP_032902116.1 protein moonraker [Amblyraja radiata]